MAEDPPLAPSSQPADEGPPPAPWPGLGLTALGLLVALVTLLAVLALAYWDGAVPAWLSSLLALGLFCAYTGLWLLLRAGTPRTVLLRLGVSLAALLWVAWGLGVPLLLLAVGLLALATLLLLSSAPIVFSSWVARTDAAVRRRTGGE